MRELMIPMGLKPIAGADYAVLTTNHSCSSHGKPVLVWQGQAYAPADVLCVEGEHVTAATVVRVHLQDKHVELGDGWFAALPGQWLAFAAWPTARDWPMNARRM